MHDLTFQEAMIAFHRGPTSKNAWNYLITAIESAAEGVIDKSMFLPAVSEVANFSAESSRGNALVELLILVSASIRLASAASASPPTKSSKASAVRANARTRRTDVMDCIESYGGKDRRFQRARVADV